MIKLQQWRQSSFDIQQTNRPAGQNKESETDRHIQTIFGIKQGGKNGSIKYVGRFNSKKNT